MIADILAFCFGLRGDARNLPVMLNVPLPIDFHEYVHGGLYVREENSCVCCGCICVKPNWKYTVNKLAMSALVPKSYGDWITSIPQRMVISPIYPGFDKTCHLQPNWVQCGPIMDPDLTECRARLGRKNEDLEQWMNDAMSNGEDCIYISLGSECEWQPWQADAFVKGM